MELIGIGIQLIGIAILLVAIMGYLYRIEKILKDIRDKK